MQIIAFAVGLLITAGAIAYGLFRSFPEEG